MTRMRAEVRAWGAVLQATKRARRGRERTGGPAESDAWQAVALDGCAFTKTSCQDSGWEEHLARFALQRNVQNSEVRHGGDGGECNYQVRREQN